MFHPISIKDMQLFTPSILYLNPTYTNGDIIYIGIVYYDNELYVSPNIVVK